MRNTDNVNGDVEQPDNVISSESQETPQGDSAVADFALENPTNTVEGTTVPEGSEEITRVAEISEDADSAEAADSASNVINENVNEDSSEDVTQSSNESSSTEASTGFDALGLPQQVLDAVRKVGFETPSPIQAQTIPVLMDGHDVVGLAQTGTGKTAAFALPVLSRIDKSVRSPQA